MDQPKKSGFFSFFRLGSKRSAKSRPDLRQNSGDFQVNTITEASGECEEEKQATGDTERERDSSTARNGWSFMRRARSQSSLTGGKKLSLQGGGETRKEGEATQGRREQEPEWIPFSRSRRVLCRSSEDMLDEPPGGLNPYPDVPTCQLRPKPRHSTRAGGEDNHHRHSVIGTYLELQEAHKGSVGEYNGEVRPPGQDRLQSQALSPPPPPTVRVCNDGSGGIQGDLMERSHDTANNGSKVTVRVLGSRGGCRTDNHPSTTRDKCQPDTVVNHPSELITIETPASVTKVNEASNPVTTDRTGHQLCMDTCTTQEDKVGDVPRVTRVALTQGTSGVTLMTNCDKPPVSRRTKNAMVSSKSPERVCQVLTQAQLSPRGNKTPITRADNKPNKDGSSLAITGQGEPKKKLNSKSKLSTTSAVGMRRLYGGSKSDISLSVGQVMGNQGLQGNGGLFTLPPPGVGSHNTDSVGYTAESRVAGEVAIKHGSGGHNGCEDKDKSVVYCEIGELLTPTDPPPNTTHHTATRVKPYTNTDVPLPANHGTDHGQPDTDTAVGESTKSEAVSRCAGNTRDDISTSTVICEDHSDCKTSITLTNGSVLEDTGGKETCDGVVQDKSLSPVPFHRHGVTHGSHDSGFYQSTPKQRVVIEGDGVSSVTTVTDASMVGEGYHGYFRGAPLRVSDSPGVVHSRSETLLDRSDSFGSLLSGSSTSEDEDEDFYDRPVVRKSRSYHDLRRQKAKKGGGHKSRSHDMLDHFDTDLSSDEMTNDDQRSQLMLCNKKWAYDVRNGRKLANLTSETESSHFRHHCSDDVQRDHLMVRDYPVTKTTGPRRDVRRAESADNLLRKRRRRKSRERSNEGRHKSSHDIYHRSQHGVHDIDLKVKDREQDKVKVNNPKAKVAYTSVKVTGDIGKMALKHQSKYRQTLTCVILYISCLLSLLIITGTSR